jgi:hypothetical protein
MFETCKRWPLPAAAVVVELTPVVVAPESSRYLEPFRKPVCYLSG